MRFIVRICLLISIIISMKSEVKLLSNRDLIKIRYGDGQKKRSKFINSKNLNYSQFAEKVAMNFNLSQQKYYRLYYLDQDKEEITVNTQQDYSVFTESMEVLVMHLQQTKDQEIDFRKCIVNSTVENLRNNLKEINNCIRNRQKEKQSLERIKGMIENKEKDMIKQINEFKLLLEKKSDKTLKERLKQIQEGLINQKAPKYDKFQHNNSCQSPIKCSCKKKIVGIRYRCVVCSADFCQSCSDEEFKNSNYHNPTHPMIMFKNSKWENKVSIEIQQPNTKSEKVVSSSSPNKNMQGSRRGSSLLEQKVAQIAGVLEWTEERARAHVLKYPNLSPQQLLDKAFES